MNKILKSLLLIAATFSVVESGSVSAPVGLAQLKDWVALAAPYPVVAIGGISLERLPGVLACLRGGNDGVAVVSAVTLAADPQQAALAGLQLAAG